MTPMFQPFYDPPQPAMTTSEQPMASKKIVFLSADHQNKPDVGSSKFREWADKNELNMLLGGSNTGVSLAMRASSRSTTWSSPWLTSWK